MANEAKIERELQWREHLESWRKSGLTQADYCRQHKLLQGDFSWWKSELARRDAGAGPFIPVRVPEAPPAREPGYSFELVMAGGRVLRFDAGVNAAVLGAVVRALEGSGPC